MKITIDKEAQKWFEDEVGIPEGEGIRFMSKIYGDSPIHDGFALAITVDKPKDPYAITIENGIPYFIAKNDEWFFDGYDLEVVLDEVLKEPKYLYHKK